MKKNSFYVFLLIIYILFLSKDTIIGFFNHDKIIEIAQASLDKGVYEEYQDLLKITRLEPLNYKLIYSKILNRNMYQFYDKITIDTGSKGNVAKGDLVINEKGVIGIIETSDNNSSEVMLLTNKDINMSVKIKNAYGILTSSNNEVLIRNIKLNEEINVGDEIYTSGLTSIPADILIGTVSEVNTDSLGLEYILKVKLASDINHIRYVGVLK